MSDFPSETELRKFLIQVSQRVQYERTRGKIIHFDESVVLPHENQCEDNTEDHQGAQAARAQGGGFGSNSIPSGLIDAMVQLLQKKADS